MIFPRRTGQVGVCFALACARATAHDADAFNTDICEKVASKVAAAPQHREALDQLIGKDRNEISIDKLAGLDDWATRLDPPAQIPANLARRLEREGNPYGTWMLSQLPGTQFYALHAVDGTMHCYSSIYFVLDHGQIQLAGAPRGIEREDGACMVSRKFSSIGALPVMLEELYTRTPAMSSWLTIASWSESQFAHSCRINFEYEPAFDTPQLESSSDCTPVECTRFQKAAAEFAKDVQDSPSNARRARISAIAPVMRERFAAALPIIDSFGQQYWGNDPAHITEEAPIRFPHVDGDKLFVVSLGHKTIGWRYFPDWAVTFHEITRDQLVERAKFEIVMSKGAIKKWTATAR